MLLVCRFSVAAADASRFASRAHRALELLGSAEGFIDGQAGRSVDDPQSWILTARFASIDAYRRALSPFEVREHVIPLLSEADTDAPSTYETLLATTDGITTHHTSLLADQLPPPSP
ncbi:antibiotic biosynthesis monooxygenase [Pseudonocardia sp. KRD291]|uniref:antibiotic biosynthesis monooxygenase family protein n=1 Tax=Pseudonocardia sp. KRD291 TaxID=2792007 RepID=UPI001C49E254|nr:antibiotic biosynthesis monooxygenase [Pseudonocardia sp. KRD291]MBW0103200.1 antibiotic biosynthesis monooxygenase [Pseudonocardia sp. KRD291]